MLPKFCWPKDIRETFGVTLPTVHRWVKDGKLPTARTPGGHLRFAYYDVWALACRGGMPIPGWLQRGAEIEAMGAQPDVFDAEFGEDAPTKPLERLPTAPFVPRHPRPGWRRPKVPDLDVPDLEPSATVEDAAE